MKQALDAVELESVVKTSGSDAIHVLVPIARRHTYEETREFSEIVRRAARTHQGLVTTEWSKRNGAACHRLESDGEGKRSPRSLRPSQAGAPVSTPLRWDEVNERLDPREFTMEVVPGGRAARRPLREPVLHGKQSLAAALKAVRGSR